MSGHTGTDATAGDPLDALADRYGRTPRARRRTLIIAWAGAIAIALVFAAWVIWVAFDGTSATVDARDIGHKVLDDRTVSISYDVSMPEGTRAACALQAQNEAHAIVGWKVVEIGASDQFTQAFTDTVRTTQRGVTGLIYACWLP